MSEIPLFLPGLCVQAGKSVRMSPRAPYAGVGAMPAGRHANTTDTLPKLLQ